MKTKCTLALVYVFVMACEYSPPVATNNTKSLPDEIDLNQIMVIGDTYASGFMDGVLTTKSKTNSYTGILQNHINTELGLEIPSNNNDTVLTSTQNLELYKNGIINSGAFELDYKTSSFIYPSQVVSQSKLGYRQENKGPYIDATFAGLNSYEIVDEAPETSNTWANEVYEDASNVSELISSNDPGFVLIQVGQSDLTNMALNGVSGKFEVLAENATTSDLISSQEYKRILTSLINEVHDKTDAQIVIFNLFDPLKAPYFQTLDYAFEPEIYSSRYVSSLAGYYRGLTEKIAQYHLENDIQFFDARPQVDYDTENWPNTSRRFRAKMVEDEYLPVLETNDGYTIPKIRMMVENEILLFNNLENIDEDSNFGGSRPLTDRETITIVESDSLQLFVSEWNNIVIQLADQFPRVHLFDLNSVIERIGEQTLSFEGVFFADDFSNKSIYSSDGYSFNPKGNSIVANQLLSLINEIFSVTFSPINPNKFPGVNYRIK